MSTKKRLTVICPQCNNSFSVEHFSSYNVQVEGHGIEPILDDSWVLHECPVCHTIIPVLDTIVFHDMEKELLLFFFPTEAEIPDERLEFINNLKVPNDYTVRMVEKDYAVFKEKIMILESGLSDLGCELYKLKAKKQLSITDPCVCRIVFGDCLTPKGIVFFLEGQKPKATIFDDNAYQDALSEINYLLPLKTIVVNQETIQKAIQEKKP